MARRPGKGDNGASGGWENALKKGGKVREKKGGK
jgi:hypothetical protein